MGGPPLSSRGEADRPEQQTTRADNPTRRNELVAAFRAAPGRIKSNQRMAHGQKDFVAGSCLRAVEFFGGALSEADQEIVNRPGRQFYVLSNEKSLKSSRTGISKLIH